MDKKRKTKYIGLIMLLAGVLIMAPNITYANVCDKNSPNYDKVSCDAQGKTPGDNGGHSVSCNIGGCANTRPENTLSGVMFSVVNQKGVRLENTYSYIISSQDVKGKKMLNATKDKMEVINDLTYIQNAYNWKKDAQSVNIDSSLANFVHDASVSINSINGAYILDYLLKDYNTDTKNWEHYLELCGYKYDKYTYEDIKNHYLIFEPMSTFSIGNRAGNFYGNYFATFQQSASLVKYLKENNRLKDGVENLTGGIPILTRLSPSIYMPVGTAGFSNGQGTASKWADVNKKIGNGIGSINVAKSEKFNPPTCNISKSEFFPINKDTGIVQNIIIKGTKDSYTIEAVDGEPQGSINCCAYFLAGKAGEDGKSYKKEDVYKLYPACAPSDTCNTKDEPGLNSCTSADFAVFKSPKKDDDNTWYCMKSLDKKSTYAKKIINKYARVVCREDLNTFFPSQLKEKQQKGGLMVWPTSSQSSGNDYPLKFEGTLTCRLSIDKAEIEETGNANNIYKEIYNAVVRYTNNNNCKNIKNENECEAKKWYKLNDTIIMNISYNDDEYGGKKYNLANDEVLSLASFSQSNNENIDYDKLDSIEIKVKKTISYKLRDDIYKLITGSGTGGNNLQNLYDKLNKNNYVFPKIRGGALPISLKAKIERNIANTNTNYYKLVLNYRGIGDSGKFVNEERKYECPYEIANLTVPSCQCPKDSLLANMSLDGYLKNDAQLTCREAQEEYCDLPPVNNNPCQCPSDSDYPNEDLSEFVGYNPEPAECIKAQNEYCYKKEIISCQCPGDSEFPNMDLTGYLKKNPKMECHQAQDLYCSGVGDMNIEYRVISLKEPFPSIKGIPYSAGGRDIGVNWRDRVKDTKAGSVVNKYIKNNRKVTDYNVYTLEPLYTIELNSVAIKEIRKYNKNNNYGDFNLTCYDEEEGKKCISKYLKHLIKSNIVTGGTCISQNPNEFYSCADKDDPIE